MANEKKLIYADDARRAILQEDPKLTYCIERIKGVDAVEVVRCKDCKHRYTTFRGLFFCTQHLTMSAKDDNFCSDGERKDNVHGND